MGTAELVEAMLAGLIRNDEACACYPALGALRARAEHGGLPLQWTLIADDGPEAWDLVMHAAGAIIDLLDTALGGWQDGGGADGLTLWRTLAAAPEWLMLPEPPDDNVGDIALLLERDEDYDGDWRRLIAALDRDGHVEWQWAIERCVAMQAYEGATRMNLRALLSDRGHVPPGG